jgi:hypothetical protein
MGFTPKMGTVMRRKRLPPQKDRQEGRDKAGRFVVGNKATNAGRPKEFADFKSQARRFMCTDGFKELISIALDKKNKQQLYALELLANYAFGRPQQNVSLENTGAPIIEIIYNEKPEERGMIDVTNRTLRLPG